MKKKLEDELHTLGEAEIELGGVLGQGAEVLAQLQLASQEEQQGRKGETAAGTQSTPVKKKRSLLKSVNEIN